MQILVSTVSQRSEDVPTRVQAYLGTSGESLGPVPRDPEVALGEGGLAQGESWKVLSSE